MTSDPKLMTISFHPWPYSRPSHELGIPSTEPSQSKESEAEHLQKLIDFMKVDDRSTVEIVKHIHGDLPSLWGGGATSLLDQLEHDKVIIFKNEIGKWSLLR